MLTGVGPGFCAGVDVLGTDLGEFEPNANYLGNAAYDGGLNAACAWNAERFADEEFSSRRSSQWDQSARGGAASRPHRGRRAQLGMPRPGPCGTSTCPSSITGSGVSEAKRQPSGTQGISNQRVAEEANP